MCRVSGRHEKATYAALATENREIYMYSINAPVGRYLMRCIAMGQLEWLGCQPHTEASMNDDISSRSDTNRNVTDGRTQSLVISTSRVSCAVLKRDKNRIGGRPHASHPGGGGTALIRSLPKFYGSVIGQRLTANLNFWVRHCAYL